MSYGSLSAPQRAALAPFVKGKKVHDIGAGDLALSNELLMMTAKQIIAVDSHEYPALRRHAGMSKPPSKIERVTTYFHKYMDPIDTAFVSWPINHYDPGLVAIVERSRVVIYLGKNSDGTACGFPAFFLPLSKREVHVYIAERANTLIVYGPRPVERPMYGEERASILIDERMWPFDELEAQVTKKRKRA